MKTIKQWLNELPEPYRSQALENADTNVLNSKGISLIGCLMEAFNWHKSTQGFEYWYKLIKSLPETK